MSANRLSGFSALLLALCLSFGCAPTGPKLPKYAAPSPGPDVAVLQGSWGTYVTRIDNRDVSSGQILLFNFGFNTVNVTSGVHTLRVETAAGNTRRWSTFPFRCDPGHKYVFSPYSPFDLTLKVTDENTKQSLVVN